jgi:hypothetical protein
MILDILRTRTIFNLLCALALTALVIACAGGENLSDAGSDDPPPGRGILTGSSGEYVIYGK